MKVTPQYVVYNSSLEDLNGKRTDEIVQGIVALAFQQHDLAIQNARANGQTGVLEGPPTYAYIPRSLFGAVFHLATEIGATRQSKVSSHELSSSTSVKAANIALILSTQLPPASEPPGMEAFTQGERQSLTKIIDRISNIGNVQGKETPGGLELSVWPYTEEELLARLVMAAQGNIGTGQTAWVTPGMLDALSHRGSKLKGYARGLEIIRVAEEQAPRTHLVRFTLWTRSDAELVQGLFERARANNSHPVEETLSRTQLAALRFLLKQSNRADHPPEMELHETPLDRTLPQQNELIKISLRTTTRPVEEQPSQPPPTAGDVTVPMRLDDLAPQQAVSPAESAGEVGSPKHLLRPETGSPRHLRPTERRGNPQDRVDLNGSKSNHSPEDMAAQLQRMMFDAPGCWVYAVLTEPQLQAFRAACANLTETRNGGKGHPEIITNPPYSINIRTLGRDPKNGITVEVQAQENPDFKGAQRVPPYIIDTRVLTNDPNNGISIEVAMWSPQDNAVAYAIVKLASEQPGQLVNVKVTPPTLRAIESLCYWAREEGWNVGIQRHGRDKTNKIENITITLWSQGDEQFTQKVLQKASGRPGQFLSVEVTLSQLRAIEHLIGERPAEWELIRGVPVQTGSLPPKERISLKFTRTAQAT